MCDIIISDEYGKQVYCQYGADAGMFLEAHKYSMHGIGEKLKYNINQKQFTGKYVLENYHKSCLLRKNVNPYESSVCGKGLICI